MGNCPTLHSMINIMMIVLIGSTSRLLADIARSAYQWQQAGKQAQRKTLAGTASWPASFSASVRSSTPKTAGLRLGPGRLLNCQLQQPTYHSPPLPTHGQRLDMSRRVDCTQLRNHRGRWAYMHSITIHAIASLANAGRQVASSLASR